MSKPTEKIALSDYEQLLKRFYALESKLWDMQSVAKGAIAEIPESDLKKQLQEKFEKLKTI